VSLFSPARVPVENRFEIFGGGSHHRGGGSPKILWQASSHTSHCWPRSRMTSGRSWRS